MNPCVHQRQAIPASHKTPAVLLTNIVNFDKRLVGFRGNTKIYVKKKKKKKKKPDIIFYVIILIRLILQFRYIYVRSQCWLSGLGRLEFLLRKVITLFC